MRATFGFGDAVVAMPLMSLVVGVRTATPVMDVVSFVVVAGVLAGARRDIDLGSVRRLLTGSLLGLPLGVLALRSAPEPVLRSLLGIAIALFGLYRLAGPALPEVRSRRWSYPFGFVSGMLGGAYNVGGPPIAVYGALRRWEPARFRATLQGYFLFTTISGALAHAAAGLWTREVVGLALTAVPGIVVALVLGHVLHGRIDPARFEVLLSVLLVALGVMLLVV